MICLNFRRFLISFTDTANLYMSYSSRPTLNTKEHLPSVSFKLTYIPPAQSTSTPHSILTSSQKEQLPYIRDTFLDTEASKLANQLLKDLTNLDVCERIVIICKYHLTACIKGVL